MKDAAPTEKLAELQIAVNRGQSQSS